MHIVLLEFKMRIDLLFVQFVLADATGLFVVCASTPTVATVGVCGFCLLTKAVDVLVFEGRII